MGSSPYSALASREGAARKLLTKLAEVAKIPGHSREAFCMEVSFLMFQARDDWRHRGGPRSLKNQPVNRPNNQLSFRHSL